MIKRDYKIAAVLLGLSLILHFAGLSYPNQVIFDEVHFGKFVTAYCCTHENFFDIHPPHAKLLIAGAAWLGGYRGGFSFEHIGQDYGTVPVAALRFVPALAGSILPVIIYGLLRQLGARRQLALLGGIAVLVENALLVQTRMISLDGVLLVGTFGSLSAYLAAWTKAGAKQYYWLAGAGALAGLAVGTKFTGLAIVGVLGIMLGVRWLKAWRERLKETLTSAGVMVLAFAVVYLAGWALHFNLLSLPGGGDAFHKSDFSGNLITDFFRETYQLHQVMLSANYGLTAKHAYASEWWQWPIMQRSVFYWQSDGRMIYFLGNPVVWWGSGVLLGTAAFVSLVMFGRTGDIGSLTRKRPIKVWVPVVGYLAAYVPLMRVPRALFLYHYLTPLLFGLVAGLLWLEILSGKYRQEKWYRWTVWGVAGLIIAGAAWWSPLTYGFEAESEWAKYLFIVKGWR